MCALRQTLTLPALSSVERHFPRTVADDTEDAPWMVLNDRQFWGASGLAWSLETYARAHRLPWSVGGMLPLTYRPPGARRRKQVAPDVFVAFVPVHARDSLAVEEEGMPPFVLEVVSPSSVKRDLEEKAEVYRLLGAREDAIVRLDLGLVLRGGTVRAETPEGELLRTLDESEAAWRREARARERAEEEAARLRAVLERLTRGEDQTPGR